MRAVLLSVFYATAAEAGVTFTVTDNGDGTISSTATGSLNLAAIDCGTAGTQFCQLNNPTTSFRTFLGPSAGTVGLMTTTNFDKYVYAGTDSWAPFGTGAYQELTSTGRTGTAIALYTGNMLGIETGYVSGTSISASGLYTGVKDGAASVSFASLGITVGTYRRDFSYGGESDFVETVTVGASSASGDVHLRHAGGGSFDVRGLDGGVFNMFQAANLSLNARFTASSFTLAPEDPRAEDVREVHGSHMTAAYVTARAGATLAEIEYDAAERPYKAKVLLTPDAGETTPLDVSTETGPLAVGDLTIEMKKGQPVELVVANSDWKAVMKPATYRTVDGERKTRLDLSVVALADPLAARVAPHGLLGQGFDGLRIEGKKDDYVPDKGGVFVTTAQGEGAIEGSVADYVVASPFATDFKFGRFGKLAAPPRNVSELNAPKGARKPMARAGATAAGDAASA
jgi:hypothetical protein